MRIHDYGGPDALVLEDIPCPDPGSGDVRLRVRAAGVNPLDCKIRAGHLRDLLPLRLPMTLGWDVAGTIDSIGDGVAGWSVGDAVYARPDILRDGAYADYMVVKASEIARMPRSLAFEEAAAVPLAALTAWRALADVGQLAAGERVLVHDGVGGVGSFAVQLAKAWGAHVVTTASTENHRLVRGLGADEVVDGEHEDVASIEPVNLVFDTVGGETQRRSLGVLKAHGGVVSTVAVDTRARAEADRRDLRLRSVTAMPDGSRLGEISTLIDEGLVRAVLDRVMPLEQAPAAHLLCARGRLRGKIVLKVA